MEENPYSNNYFMFHVQKETSMNNFLKKPIVLKDKITNVQT
jgi:hypothetical protein